MMVTDVGAVAARQIEVRAVDVDAAGPNASRVSSGACGGTHLSNTGQSAPIRIVKIENKSRRNRRVRFAFAEPS